LSLLNFYSTDGLAYLPEFPVVILDTSFDLTASQQLDHAAWSDKLLEQI
jgi:hypothetical protein